MELAPQIWTLELKARFRRSRRPVEDHFQRAARTRWRHVTVAKYRWRISPTINHFQWLSGVLLCRVASSLIIADHFNEGPPSLPSPCVQDQYMHSRVRTKPTIIKIGRNVCRSTGLSSKRLYFAPRDDVNGEAFQLNSTQRGSRKQVLDTSISVLLHSCLSNGRDFLLNVNSRISVNNFSEVFPSGRRKRL